MKPQFIAASVALTAIISFAPVETRADDAPWGCQVLLCAASSNPSWHGVPYCKPPMYKLIAAMAKPGFLWPICPSSGTGKPGREIYEECPAGFKVAYSESGHDGNRSEPNRCEKTVNVCQDRNAQKNLGKKIQYRGTAGDVENSCLQTTSQPRKRRADPYFFDIRNDQGVKQRYWFNLNR
jgi:hypothetical protein